MFPRATLLFLFSCIVLCLAENPTNNVSIIATTTMSKSEILLTVSACSTGSVLLVLLPTIVYQKFLRSREEIV